VKFRSLIAAICVVILAGCVKYYEEHNAVVLKRSGDFVKYKFNSRENLKVFIEHIPIYKKKKSTNASNPPEDMHKKAEYYKRYIKEEEIKDVASIDFDSFDGRILTTYSRIQRIGKPDNIVENDFPDEFKMHEPEEKPKLYRTQTGDIEIQYPQKQFEYKGDPHRDDWDPYI